MMKPPFISSQNHPLHLHSKVQAEMNPLVKWLKRRHGITVYMLIFPMPNFTIIILRSSLFLLIFFFGGVGFVYCIHGIISDVLLVIFCSLNLS